MNDCSIEGPEPAIVTTESTMFDRWTDRSRVPRWAAIGAIGSVLCVIPLVLAAIDGVGLGELFDGFRAQFVYALMVVYMLAVLRPLEESRTNVAMSLRPLLEIDDKRFAAIVNYSSRIQPRHELVALAVGMLAGLVVNVVFEPVDAGPFWLNRYAYVSRIGLFGVGIWTIFVIITVTRMTNVLLAQPSRIDIFNLQPFVPVGRQSAWLSLAVVGAVTLSLFSASFQEPGLWLEYGINYCVLLLVIVAVFLLNTHTVHRLLASAKDERLASVDGYLTRAYRKFEESLSSGTETHTVATEINALATLKNEVKHTRTWPYNTEMLRTVAISVATPIVVGVSRIAVVLLTADRF